MDLGVTFNNFKAPFTLYFLYLALEAGSHAPLPSRTCYPFFRPTGVISLTAKAMTLTWLKGLRNEFPLVRSGILSLDRISQLLL